MPPSGLLPFTSYKPDAYEHSVFSCGHLLQLQWRLLCRHCAIQATDATGCCRLLNTRFRHALPPPGSWRAAIAAGLPQNAACRAMLHGIQPRRRLALLAGEQLPRSRQQRVALACFRLPAAAEAHAAFPVQQKGVPAKVKTRCLSCRPWSSWPDIPAVGCPPGSLPGMHTASKAWHGPYTALRCMS